MKTENIKRLVYGILLVLLLLCVCVGVDYATNNITFDEDLNITNINNTTNAGIIKEYNDDNVTLLNGSYYVLPKDSGWAKTDGKIYKVNESVKKKAKKEELPVITITGKPSCYTCWKNHRPYKWFTRSYLNYCPNCDRYGTLYNAHKGGSRFEQEITCRRCDCDFCVYCGRDKVGGGGRHNWNILRRVS